MLSSNTHICSLLYYYGQWNYIEFSFSKYTDLGHSGWQGKAVQKAHGSGMSLVLDLESLSCHILTLCYWESVWSSLRQILFINHGLLLKLVEKLNEATCHSKCAVWCLAQKKRLLFLLHVARLLGVIFPFIRGNI